MPNIFYLKPKFGTRRQNAEARKHRERQGDDFVGPGGNSANPEAGKSLLRGSWRLYTPFLSFYGFYFMKFTVVLFSH